MIDGASLRDKALRPSSTLVAVSMHALVLMGVALPRPPLASPAENIEISIEPQQGDASPDASQSESMDSIAQAQAQPDAKPDAKPDEVKDEPPPEPEPVKEKPQPVAAEAPRREVADAPQIARRLEREREKKREKKRREVLAQKAAAQSAHHARAGVAEGSQHAGLSRATFGSRMLAEIRRHQIHAMGEGSVRVAFTVGGSGSVSAASVISSSGDGSLEATAVRIVRSCHPGPPPGGSYSASATINFR
jgi:protein TonB